MLPPTAENRSYFTQLVAKHCGGDLAKADTCPMDALIKSVMEISTREDAEKFLAGHVHWLQGRKPRQLEDALAAARANFSWAFDNMKPDMIEMWNSLWETPVEVPAKSPQEAFRASQRVGEKIKQGKDPIAIAALARKALQKKSAAR